MAQKLHLIHPELALGQLSIQLFLPQNTKH